MGVLKTLTDEYFGEDIRKEDLIDISGLDVEIVSFTDNNGKFHKHGYRVKDGHTNEMAKTLKTLIKRAIELRGPECSLNDIDVSNIKKLNYVKNTSTNSVLDENFNGDISGWNTINVENFKYLFLYNKLFNGNISKWNTSNAINMVGMFQHSSFNGDISSWNTINVEDMSYMFCGSKFNGNISDWKLDNVTNMCSMFSYTGDFNQPLDKWGDKISNVKDMNWMFFNSDFNKKIENWKVRKDCQIDRMFENTPLEKKGKLPKWYLDRIK